MATKQKDIGFDHPKAVSRIGPATIARGAEIARRLQEEYPGAPVPSLNFRDPYQCVVAISLSAQTTDDNVNKVLPELFERYPDATALASAEIADLERIIHSLGFYHSKAKNLLGLARVSVTEFDGQIPATMAELIRLPGVARKTANLVLTESFGIVQGIAVDTHVFRIAHKLGLSKAKTPAQTEGDLCKVFDYDHWYRINYEMITHGRRVCIAGRPKCGECVLRDLCPGRER
ncbi:MAG: endonuclease III [Actinomycetia bacterium]|nr:endonuclease III [Actinomycetes bacterium]